MCVNVTSNRRAFYLREVLHLKSWFEDFTLIPLYALTGKCIITLFWYF